jgi:hypothetical protein
LTDIANQEIFAKFSQGTHALAAKEFNSSKFLAEGQNSKDNISLPGFTIYNRVNSFECIFVLLALLYFCCFNVVLMLSEYYCLTEAALSHILPGTSFNLKLDFRTLQKLHQF